MKYIIPRFYEGLRPSVVICCPDLAHKVLVKHFNKFSTRPVGIYVKKSYVNNRKI
jgi:hypothetical protein